MNRLSATAAFKVLLLCLTGSPLPAATTIIPAGHGHRSLAYAASGQLGELVREVVTGQFTLSLALQQSADLTNFTPFPLSPAATIFTGAGTLAYRFASPTSALFYRVSAGN
jgi:hypothetical protein